MPESKEEKSSLNKPVNINFSMPQVHHLSLADCRSSGSSSEDAGISPSFPQDSKRQQHLTSESNQRSIIEHLSPRKSLLVTQNRIIEALAYQLNSKLISEPDKENQQIEKVNFIK